LFEKFGFNYIGPIDGHDLDSLIPTLENIKQLKDGWTILTADGKPSAHFEHDVAIIDGKPEILSTFKYIYDALGIVSNEEDEFRRTPLS
jgi:methionyl aminopeptidase